MLNLNKKLKVFEILCGDWDYRNIDMTSPHIQKIDILQNNILVSCELFSPIIDDYVFCDGGIINDKSLVKNFKKLNLNDKESVLNFISNIEDRINWNKINDDLYSQVDLKKSYLRNDEGYDAESFCDDYYEDDTIIVLAEKLGQGWNWHKYDDGSGYLESPEGKKYMSYDLQTNEYKVTNNSNYDLFPLNYYYIDGVDPSEFDPFEYMENEMIDYVLPKEKNNEDINL